MQTMAINYIEQAQQIINEISCFKRETSMAVELLDNAIEALRPPEKKKAIPTRKLDRKKCLGCSNSYTWNSPTSKGNREMMGCKKSCKPWCEVLRLCIENKWYFSERGPEYRKSILAGGKTDKAGPQEEGMSIESENVWKAFWWGVGYGQLLMEEERENEELFDAAVCYQSGLKYGIPSNPVQRRQIKSDKWFSAMREGYAKFLELYNGLYGLRNKAGDIKNV
jgi:hypothetical protein